METALCVERVTKEVTTLNRHLLIMVLCCAIPLGLIFALPYLGVSLSSSGWLLLILLLCPLMHILMMGRHGSEGHAHDESQKGGDPS